jgi:hypothetical protein
LGYVSVQDPKISLNEEGINKQNIINSARYSSYPIFINLNNPTTNPMTTNGNNSGSTNPKQTNENSQNIMANFNPSYPVIGSNTYSHYYTKVNNVNLINYYIPAHAAAHPPGSPYQSRAHPLGYTVETIPIIPAANQALYSVASNNNLTIPEGGLYHTYHSLVPVVVDSSLNPIIPHENLINEAKTTNASTSINNNNKVNSPSMEHEKENQSQENIKNSTTKNVNENKNEHNYNKQGNGTPKLTYSKKYSTSKSENKKLQWPNSQFHVNKAMKKSSLDGHKILKQKIKEDESSITHDTSININNTNTNTNTNTTNTNNTNNNNNSSNNNNNKNKIKEGSINVNNISSNNNGNSSHNRKQNNINMEDNNEENYTIHKNNFAIKANSNSKEGPSEFSLVDNNDSEQDVISVDSIKSEEERTLYNEELYCEPSQTESEDDDIESNEDIKGTGQSSSNINIRNNVTGNKSSEILLNIKNKNSGIEINLENNIIVNDVLIDYKNNNKENKNSNSNKGKRSITSQISPMHDINKRNEKGKLFSKPNSISNSTTTSNISSKEKKIKKNNGNKDTMTKGNSQSKNETKVKRNNNGNNIKNKNIPKNNKKEENKSKRKNSTINHKNHFNSSFTLKEGKLNKNKEIKDKMSENGKGDETTVITTVTTTIITNNSNSINKNINTNVNGGGSTMKKEDITTMNGKSPSNLKKSTNKTTKPKKQQKFKKNENDPNKKNITNGIVTSSTKKKFKNGTFISKNKPGKVKSEDNINNNNNKNKVKGNKKIKKAK